jgi:hypothetical protein
MTKLSETWKRLSPEWRFAILAFLVVRLSLSLWSLVVYSIFPVALQNLDLFGEPILTVFDLKTSERYIYSREVDGVMLTFRALDAEHVTDDQTGSIWLLQNGQAIQGAYAGKSLHPSSHSLEEIFPYKGISPAKNIVLALWQRFDANWYLKIATQGYDGSDGSTVYFPMYPLLIRGLSFFIPSMFAAMLISNLALIGVLVLLYRLASRIIDESAVRRTLIYFLVFPTSFFLTSAYTESLFLLFTLGSLYSASHRKWGWSVLWGVLAALTRLQGAILVVPLAYLLWREIGIGSMKKLIVRVLPLGFIPLVTLTFISFSSFSMLNTYQGTWHARLAFPWEAIGATIALLLSGDGGIVDALNLVVTMGLIAMMFAVWKRLPLEYTFYSLPMLLIPLLRMNAIQPLVSMSRYALVVFPVFIVLGMWGKYPWANRIILYTSILLQLYLSAQFILWGWVA